MRINNRLSDIFLAIVFFIWIAGAVAGTDHENTADETEFEVTIHLQELPYVEGVDVQKINSAETELIFIPFYEAENWVAHIDGTFVAGSNVWTDADGIFESY